MVLRPLAPLSRTFHKEWAERDLNPHALRHTALNRTRPVQVVGAEGVEPSRTCVHTLLKRTRMPVPPRAHQLYGVNLPIPPPQQILFRFSNFVAKVQNLGS